MKTFSTQHYDVLYNFISPVTGRILADYNYILIGNREGIATPSPILLDIQLELIALKKRFNMLVLTDFVTGHQNDELGHAQVLADMVNGFLYSTAGVVSTLTTVPLSGLPDLTEDYLWTGDSSNRPIEVQRIKLSNLPDFQTVDPRVNFGVKNLYTGSTPGLSGVIPATTLQIDMSNLPDLPVGYLWIGQSVPLMPSDFPNPPVNLNWGSNRPVAVSTILSSNLPDLAFKRIWRGDITNRPVESDDLTTAEVDILALESEIAVIEGEIAAIQSELLVIEADLAAINVTLYTPVVGLVSVVAGLVVTVAAHTVSIGILLARTLDAVPLAVADVDLNNNRIINLSDPVDPLDAVNYQTLIAYVGAGAVTSISGTANRITASASVGAVTLDIAATYVGQTSITTLGTIGTGTWNGSIVGLAYGGTNANLTPNNGGIVYSTATGLAISTAVVTPNRPLLSGAATTPFWSSATFPVSTTANELLYSVSANVITGLATANNAVLLTDGSGVPAWQTLTSSAVTSISGTANRITASASTGAVTIDISSSYVGQTSITTLGTIGTGTWHGSIIDLPYGGTNANLTPNNGGIVYSTATGFAISTAVVTANRPLLSGATTTPTWSSATFPTSTVANELLYSSATNTLTGLATANNAVLLTNGSGVPAWQTLTSNVVTSISGTSNRITASASTGAVTIDISSSYVGQTSITTLGTIGTGTWNGTDIGLSDGGTNASLTASNGGIVYSTATAMAILAGTATANKVLLSGSSAAPSWSSATYPASTTINRILYSSATNTVDQIATANNAVLLTNGSGVPAWQTLTSNVVTSITGTANQITASASTGAVTLSMPADVVVSTSVTGGSVKISSGTVTTTSGALTMDPNGSSNVFINSSPSGSSKVGIGASSGLLHFVDIRGDVIMRRLVADNSLSTTIPSISLGSTSQVGTGASSSTTGGELAGTFTLNTGTGTLATGTLATFTLVSAMPNSTFTVIFFAFNSATAPIHAYGTATSTTVFTLSTATALTASTTYRWNFMIVGYRT